MLFPRCLGVPVWREKRDTQLSLVSPNRRVKRTGVSAASELLVTVAGGCKPRLCFLSLDLTHTFVSFGTGTCCDLVIARDVRCSDLMDADS
jgi:hypothetical protein